MCGQFKPRQVQKRKKIRAGTFVEHMYILSRQCRGWACDLSAPHLLLLYHFLFLPTFLCQNLLPVVSAGIWLEQKHVAARPASTIEVEGNVQQHHCLFIIMKCTQRNGMEGKLATSFLQLWNVLKSWTVCPIKLLTAYCLSDFWRKHLLTSIKLFSSGLFQVLVDIKETSSH